MTIHADWIAIMKDNCPAAFTPDLPFVPEFGFIDGMIKLMAMPRPQTGPTTWEYFIRRQFVTPIERHWRAGARTCILAYDDSRNVPKAKAITQASRRVRITPIQFEKDDMIPEFPPDPWDAAMANRTFKTAVQGLVIEALPMVLAPPHTPCKLIVDWQGSECTVWTWHEDGTVTHSSEPRLQTGEADIKFIQWCQKLEWAPGAIEATDGDFVPIALLAAPQDAPIAILRYEIKLKKEKSVESVGKPLKRYEWVNIAMVREQMVFQMSRYKGKKNDPFDQWEITCLVAMITLTGTDYSRGLPWIGPKKVWKHLPTALPRVLGSFHDQQLDPELAIDWLVAHLYAQVYQTHTSPGTFEAVMRGIQRSRLSESTKAKMPSPQQILTTLRNATFVLEYWKCSTEPLDSMDGFGFRFNDKGLVEWAD